MEIRDIQTTKPIRGSSVINYKYHKTNIYMHGDQYNVDYKAEIEKVLISKMMKVILNDIYSKTEVEDVILWENSYFMTQLDINRRLFSKLITYTNYMKAINGGGDNIKLFLQNEILYNISNSPFYHHTNPTNMDIWGQIQGFEARESEYNIIISGLDIQSEFIEYPTFDDMVNTSLSFTYDYDKAINLNIIHTEERYKEFIKQKRTEEIDDILKDMELMDQYIESRHNLKNKLMK